jgi:hypothetical protein
MMTSLAELICRIRDEFLDDIKGSDDDIGSFRWSSRNITNAINESVREVAKRCLIIDDYMTQSICQLALTADSNGNYPQSLQLSSKILRIRFVLFPRENSTTQFHELTRTSTDRMNSGHRGESGGGWHNDSFEPWAWLGHKGHVKRFMTDMQSGYITFDRQPLYGGTVKLGVYRLPLKDIEYKDMNAAEQTYPEIQEQDIVLIHGALKHLYSKEYSRKDSETFDAVEMDRWYKEFEKDIDKITQEKAIMQPRNTIVRPEPF